MGTWDQYDLSNGAGTESMFRALLLQECTEKKKKDTAAAVALAADGSSSSKPTAFEKGLILGNRHVRGVHMLPPEFIAWMSGEMLMEATVQKGVTKLAETEAIRGKKK